MSIATQKRTFEEFVRLPESDARCELVDGELVPLVSPTVRLGTAQGRLMRVLDEYLGDDFRGIIGTEIDVPTLRHFGRRPDVVYLAPEHVSPQDWERGYPAHAPDLVVEVLSKGDETRDTRERRREYALVGIPHYWIVDPVARAVLILVLSGDGEYHSDRVLTLDDELTSPLFPGLSVPVRRLLPGP